MGKSHLTEPCVSIVFPPLITPHRRFLTQRYPGPSSRYALANRQFLFLSAMDLAGNFSHQLNKLHINNDI